MSEEAIPKMGVPNAPAFVLLYGPSGVGKTVIEGRAFPNGLYICVQGALESVRVRLGYDVAQSFCYDLRQILVTLQSPDVMNQFNAVIIDDFSFICEETLRVMIAGMDPKMDQKDRESKAKKMFKDLLFEFRTVARNLGMHVILSCWQQDVSVFANKKKIGGPKLPTGLMEILPPMCDMVLRVGPNPMSNRRWKNFISMNGSSVDYIEKNRLFPVANATVPPNLGELLRASGYDNSPWPITRHSVYGALESEIIEAIYPQFEAATIKEFARVAQKCYADLMALPEFAEKTYPIEIAQNIVQDCWDRAELAHLKRENDLNFFVG